MKLNPGDICLFDPAISLSCVVITKVERTTPEPVYLCLDLKNRDDYLIKEHQLIKIGTVSAELGHEGVKALLFQKPPLPSEDDLEFLHGRARAKKEVAIGLPGHRTRWQLLAQAKPGDVLKIHSRHGIEEVTFHNVLERGAKYVFLAAKSDLKVYRFALTSLCMAEMSPHQ